MTESNKRYTGIWPIYAAILGTIIALFIFIKILNLITYYFSNIVAYIYIIAVFLFFLYIEKKG
jgi:hypothetical protein